MDNIKKISLVAEDGSIEEVEKLTSLYIQKMIEMKKD